jgi:hypothetical protein
MAEQNNGQPATAVAEPEVKQAKAKKGTPKAPAKKKGKAKKAAATKGAAGRVPYPKPFSP